MGARSHWSCMDKGHAARNENKLKKRRCADVEYMSRFVSTRRLRYYAYGMDLTGATTFSALPPSLSRVVDGEREVLCKNSQGAARQL